MKDYFLKRCMALSIPIIFMSSFTSPDFDKEFKNPSADYRPMPFWHIKGITRMDKLHYQVAQADSAHFGGVTPLPIIGLKPDFLSESYFKMYNEILDDLKERGMKSVLYDDVSFPSGIAGGLIQKNYPEYLRKRLTRTVYPVKGPLKYKVNVPEGKLMAVVAMNDNKERIDLANYSKGKTLEWDVPEGNWRVMFFNLERDQTHKKYLGVDIMDSTAMNKFIELTYDKYSKKLGSRFGDMIHYTFFDDVGFLRSERAWTGKFNEKFYEIYGMSPSTLYPALWENIGKDTEAARVMLYNTRAELLAEGFPKYIGKWADKNGLKSTGHPPGNYNPMPVDMSGDIFKFYRYTQAPLMDVIIDYGYGRDGHKLISSAAEYYDKPIVGAEIYGAIKENVFDANMLYRIVMETMSRGANFIVPHGMWYDDKVGIPPLISISNPKLREILPQYSDYVGRMSYMLRGGRRVSDIAVIYPIADLQAWYRLESPDNKKRPGHWAPGYCDYLKISDELTCNIHRDFTFVHPEFLISDKYKIKGNELLLDNRDNYQNYKVIIMPGQKVMSVKALKKIKDFFDAGGKVIATTKLPDKSAEIGKDGELKGIINYLFPNANGNITVNKGKNGGISVFVKNSSTDNIEQALNAVEDKRDVIFESLDNTIPKLGCFSYVHKIKDGKSFFYFANSTDNKIDTDVLLRGKFNLESWNAYNGKSDKISSTVIKKDNMYYTKFRLQIDKVSSVLIVEK